VFFCVFSEELLLLGGEADFATEAITEAGNVSKDEIAFLLFIPCTMRNKLISCYEPRSKVMKVVL